MRPLAFLALLAAPAVAHVVSMSSGDLRIDGARAHFELRMPLYEIAHVPDPARSLLDHVHFSAAGHSAMLRASACAAEPERDSYQCTADYQFPSPPDSIDVECTLAAITVPNHVHLLRAELGDKHDQAIFDSSFTRSTLRFRPPTPFETAITEAGAGFIRALGGAAQILFLAALALAARNRKELAMVAAMFLLGETAAVVVVPHTAWQPAPRFVEAAAALTIAYLAVEILLLPKAGSRWLVAGALGIFHGLYFHLFLQTTAYHPLYVLAGAAIAELIALALLAILFLYVSRITRAVRPVQVAASALLLFGLIWFFGALWGRL